MNLLGFVCICLTVTVVVGLPQRGIYRTKSFHRKASRQDDVNVTTTVPPVTASSTTPEDSGEDQTEAVAQEVQEVVTPSAVVPPVSAVFPSSSILKSPVSSPRPSSTLRPSDKPIAEPTREPEPVVEVPVPVAPAVNQTKGEEEDDSSSEEEDEAEVRQLPPIIHQLKPEKINKKSRNTRPVVPAVQALKTGVVRGYLSDTGELLVPISAFPENFRYSVIHDVPDKTELAAEDVVPASSEEAVDKVEDVETQSEEVAPLKAVSPSSAVFEGTKGQVGNDTEPASGSEESSPDSSSVEENEEKVQAEKVVVESAEKPAAGETVVKTPPTSVFNPPPLAALPATKPTDEDDEEEAGGRRLYRPEFPYYVNPYNFNPNYYYEDYDF